MRNADAAPFVLMYSKQVRLCGAESVGKSEVCPVWDMEGLVRKVWWGKNVKWREICHV